MSSVLDPAQQFVDLSPVIAPTTATRPQYRTVDVHTHLAVPAAAALAKPWHRPELEPRARFSSPETLAYTAALRATPQSTARFEDAESRLVDMDAQGIDTQVLAVPPTEYFYWLPDSEAVRVCRAQHERLAEVVARFPGRFAAIANLPLAHPDLAVEMLREAHDLGMGGFELSADVMRADGTIIELDDRRYDELWSTATDLAMTAVLHPQGFTHGERFSDYYLVNVMCMPLASTLAVTRMILGGVWHRHPELQMVVVHGGGYLPFYVARTDHAWRHRPELRHHIDRAPSDYLRLLHVDTNVFEPAMVGHLVAQQGADRVLLGTDYPFDMGTPDPLGFLEDAGLTEDQRRLVLGGNAQRLFRIG
ncbi:aminocarboxymuconate-semialdehyde decarboxylase [Nocardioides salarius]|uniref:Aminocarboxymuconate-semialdehyde decarboxylase n=1 Tax=Nocardioides salarius TaxID=374513 RepID=A0ABS2MA28_9ACTN|nr:amidohydrolase family protein [Nocardioides salarius]MBM7508048.1 aminocarboxymuconate-semialdehyde decarboxylase [Nocardioides salarius]